MRSGGLMRRRLWHRADNGSTGSNERLKSIPATTRNPGPGDRPWLRRTPFPVSRPAGTLRAMRNGDGRRGLAAALALLMALPMAAGLAAATGDRRLVEAARTQD